MFLLLGLVFVYRSFYGMRISLLTPSAHIAANLKRDNEAAAAAR